ncbi:Endogenous retrovirus group 3 member 1 Env polyprotein, partial [Plecturocebus cupreus]
MGYCTPICMLNHIIRLQTVLENITNKTASALDLLASFRLSPCPRRKSMWNVQPNCCLEIDDNGKGVMEITAKMRKLAHVPVQTWKSGMSLDSLFR